MWTSTLSLLATFFLLVQPRISLAFFCKITLLAHVQLFIHQNPQVLLDRAALSVFFSQSVLMFRIAPAQVQHFTLGLVEPLLVNMGPLFKPAL